MRYSKIESSIWHDEIFLRLEAEEQRLWLYILTCPHGNLLGLFVLKDGYACEDLKIKPETFHRLLLKLIEEKLIEYDGNVQLVWIKNHLKHNPITNPNQRKAAKEILLKLPRSNLIQQFRKVVGKDFQSPSLSPSLSPFEVLSEPDSDTDTDTESVTGSEFLLDETHRPVKLYKQKVKSNHDIRLFIDFYYAKFKEKFGVNPRITGKEAKQIERLLEEMSLEELERLIAKFFLSEDKWIQDSNYNIGVFESQINKLRIEENRVPIEGNEQTIYKLKQLRKKGEGKK